ncbi:hypothetical protein DT426_20895 [Bacillus cereus]|uniref:hypothetical protein n=1 Tax=Bacillus cereus group TaxID=86661 RepID=UPI000BEDAE35|nr:MULTISPECIES: hypothetical protein [Bacillus cereus group]MED1637350.1 hypothetical protein [Bacillus thuringiensis]AZV68008.1 hypothetical protein DT426_20895 [Bacillus cereus]MDC6156538.1 hypothetical protein [Bacillus albus]MDD8006015.1 hypothetical protein [Bacillus albus]PDY90647.1 hypothetical protein CON67_11545 [Bacillus toyonensis]
MDLLQELITELNEEIVERQVDIEDKLHQIRNRKNDSEEEKIQHSIDMDKMYIQGMERAINVAKSFRNKAL